MVDECYNDMCCCDYLVSSVCSFVLDQSVFCQRAVWRYFTCCSGLNEDYVMFLTPRVYRFHLLTGYRMWTYMWIKVCEHCYDFRICVRVVFATRTF